VILRIRKSYAKKSRENMQFLVFEPLKTVKNRYGTLSSLRKYYFLKLTVNGKRNV
jgi:hypothetical protein